MKSYILYEPATGIITQQGISASDDLSHLESITGCTAIESPPVKQLECKVVLESFTWAGFQRFKATIVDKTPEEIEKDKPKKIPESKKQAHITNGQYEDLLKRIAELENR